MSGMLRIIGGTRRRQRIQVPPGRQVRPMTDRVREALFDMLGPTVAGRPVIDLFAGSGALGLEALSRGADRATFVESRPEVAACLRANIRRLRFDAQAVVCRADAYRWVQHREDWPQQPAVIFIAPPYEHFRARLGQLASLWQHLVRQCPPETAMAIQAPSRFDSAACLPPEQLWLRRRYGETALLICRALSGPDLPQAAVGQQG